MKLQMRPGTLLFITMLALSLGVAAAHAQGNGKGKGGGGNDGGGNDGGNDPPLPAVTYELVYVDQFGMYVNEMNNLGMVVGWSTIADVRSASFIDPLLAAQTFLFEVVAPDSIPEGFTLSSAVGINDHGVIVGYMTDAEGIRHPYAVDTSLSTPVVDLLPVAGGLEAFAYQVNNDGLVMGDFMLPDGTKSVWYFDPGYYGDPADRNVRGQDGDGNPLPLDLTNETAILLDVELGEASCWYLNDSTADRPAQFIGGMGSTPFRYTLGADPALEVFSDISTTFGLVGDLNSIGTWAARASVPVGTKGKKTVYEQRAFRYSSELIALPNFGDGAASTRDINNLNEVVDGDGFVFRDWNDGLGERWVELRALLPAVDQSDWEGLGVDLDELTNNGIIFGRVGINADYQYFYAIPSE